MSDYTEKQMADSFRSVLDRKHGIDNFPKFHYVFSEVVSQQGIPDFVALNFKKNSAMNRAIYRLKFKSTNNCALIFSLLKKGKPTSIKSLTEKTGLSRQIINSSIKELSEALLIEPINNDSYIVNRNFVLPNIDIWAFELKKSNWKRALFQALQYRAFANYVFVVFPFQKERLLRANIHQFISLEVGVMLYDMINCEYKVIYKPKKREPISKIHKLGLLAQLLADFQQRFLSGQSGF